MMFALGFVSVFVTGGLGGMFLAQPSLDIFLHGTYFVVGHFHMVMGVAVIRFAVAQNVLRFGEFQTKAGRLSPYFFNSGLFQDGAALRELCQFYAQAIVASKVEFDMLFGPAYKGIPLVAGTSIALSEMGLNVPYCFNRKEAKDHGEGGSTVGAKLQGNVLIIDDVISAGTSVREL